MSTDDASPNEKWVRQNELRAKEIARDDYVCPWPDVKKCLLACADEIAEQRKEISRLCEMLAQTLACVPVTGNRAFRQAAINALEYHGRDMEDEKNRREVATTDAELREVWALVDEWASIVRKCGKNMPIISDGVAGRTIELSRKYRRGSKA
jgi:hypothetical protein